MKIRMTKTAAGPDYNFQAGQEYTVDNNVGQRFINAKAAVRVGAGREPVPEPPVIETASMEPETEKAVMPVAQPKRGRKKK